MSFGLMFLHPLPSPSPLSRFLPRAATRMRTTGRGSLRSLSFRGRGSALYDGGSIATKTSGLRAHPNSPANGCRRDRKAGVWKEGCTAVLTSQGGGRGGARKRVHGAAELRLVCAFFPRSGKLVVNWDGYS